MTIINGNQSFVESVARCLIFYEEFVRFFFLAGLMIINVEALLVPSSYNFCNLFFYHNMYLAET